MILNEQTVLVTGAAGSIGTYLAEDLYDRCRKIIVVDKDPDKLNQLRARLKNIDVYVCDLTDGDRVAGTVSAIYQKHAVSVLINNAGFIHSEPLINILKPDDKKHSYLHWDATIKANLYTTFYVTVNVVEKLVAHRLKGLIINISSISAKGNIGQTAYAAAKAGIEAMTVTWSKELGMFGIRSTAIAPGFFDTPSTRESLSETNLKKWTKAIPLNRLGVLKELSSAVNFIIENDYYDGQTLEINGGLKI